MTDKPSSPVDARPGLGSLISISAAAITGKHDERALGRALVAPVAAEESNALRPVAFPVACWRAADVNFKFDSSFISPRMRQPMADFKSLLDAHPKCPITLFGHADPVGNDDFNKALSGRRAQAVFALLSRRVDLWEELHQHGDYGDKAHQAMIAELGFKPDADDKTGKSAVKAFQKSAGLPESGSVDGATRKKLYLAYMDALCRDAKDKPYTLEPTRFLGQGKDKKGKADFQGCGEFNPVLIFSKEEKADLDKDVPQRNDENAPNRRVLALLFAPGTLTSPSDWPCPRASEGAGGCRARFFTDKDKRVANGEERREFKKTRDTFGCRFYHHLNAGSPCERFVVGGGLLLAQIFSADGLVALQGRKFKLRSANGLMQLSGELDDDGILRQELVPADDYTASVEGCSEDARLVVMRMSESVPGVHFLENGRLAIRVETPTGEAVVDAKVNVEGVGERLTDDDGVAYFGTLPEGDLKFTATKDGFEPARGTAPPATVTTSSALVGAPPSRAATTGGGTTGDGNGGGSAQVKDARVDAKVSLQRKILLNGIRLEQVGAISARSLGRPPDQVKQLDPSKLGPIVATSDSVSDKSMVVFIRGSDPIKLIADTDPPGFDAQWTVTPGAGADAAGTDLSAKTGNDVLLTTGGVGLFTVSSTVGTTKLFCHVVLAGVEVDPNSPITPRDSGLIDMATFQLTPEGKKLTNDPIDPTRLTGVASGIFEFGKHPWSSEVSVTLRGGGADGKLGLDRVQVHFIQNGSAIRTRGIYDTVRRAVAEPPPLLDTSETSPSPYKGPIVGPGNGIRPQTPFLFQSGMVREKSRTDTKRVFEVGDSPAAGFKNREKGPAGQDEFLKRIEDHLEFRTVVVSVSTDAFNSIIAHAESVWRVDFSGEVEDAKTKGVWVKGKAAGVTLPDPKGWRPLRKSSSAAANPGPMGITVFNARLEIFPPLMADETNKLIK